MSAIVNSLYESLFSLRVDEPWMDEAICAQIDPELFFPEGGIQPKEAKVVCGTCPVRSKCLEYELKFSRTDDSGIWGGTTEKERAIIRLAMKKGCEVDYANPDIAALRSVLVQEDLEFSD